MSWSQLAFLLKGFNFWTVGLETSDQAVVLQCFPAGAFSYSACEMYVLAFDSILAMAANDHSGYS